MSKMTKEDLASFFYNVSDCVYAVNRAHKSKTAQTLVEPWTHGVCLVQDQDEIWLTNKQAINLIKELQRYYPK